MRWRKIDLEKYVQAKEYVDTILLPLVPFRLGNDEEAQKNSFQEEVMDIFAHEIEQELSGRVMLIPSYYYLKNEAKETEAERINQWVEDAKLQPFQHIVLLTFDSAWKKVEQELHGNLLWLPGMQTGDFQSKEMQQLIRDQIGQLSEIIRSYW